MNLNGGFGGWGEGFCSVAISSERRRLTFVHANSPRDSRLATFHTLTPHKVFISPREAAAHSPPASAESVI